MRACKTLQRDEAERRIDFQRGWGVLILAHRPSLRECDSAVNDGERWLRRWCIVWGS